jgi:antitoxin FitA
MPTTVTVRDVPDDVRDELAARAARSGRSLQAYLRARLIEFAERPDANELLERIAERKRVTGTVLTVAEILGRRDADRR